MQLYGHSCRFSWVKLGRKMRQVLRRVPLDQTVLFRMAEFAQRGQIRVCLATQPSVGPMMNLEPSRFFATRLATPVSPRQRAAARPSPVWRQQGFTVGKTPKSKY